MHAQASVDLHEGVKASLRQAVDLHRQSRYSEAERIYRQILQQEPNQFEALHLLGVVALQTARPEESIGLIGQAIAINPGLAAAHSNLGSAFIALGRHDDAAVCLERAIALDPAAAELHNNHAAALSGLKRYAEALAACDRALALRPDYVEAHNNHAHALIGLRRYAEALASCDDAIARKPGFAEAHNNRGIALNALARHEEAVASCARAITLNPGYAEACNTCATALCNLSRPEQALALYDRAITLKPAYAEAHSNRAAALAQLNRHEEAIASYDRAVALRPDYAEAHFSKSLHLLALGRFAEGWPLYEWRNSRSGAAIGSRPLWRGGGSIAGKTILLREEQGLGDTIQFCRYAPLVARLGARVVLDVSPALASLLSRLDGVAQIVARGTPLPEYDLECPMLSLPLAFKTDLASIPSTGPYLSADPEKASAWRNRLGGKTKLRVGLVWSGGIRAGRPDAWVFNSRRNVRLSALAPLGNAPVEFYSLQKGQPGETELADVKRTGWDGPDIVDFTGDLHDFSDTAALMANLDLIVTVDTAAAHLAGALGKPVWILNRFDSCWRWLTGRTDSPWYPTATLYRQPAAGDWDGVIARVRADLCALAAAG